MFCIVDTSIYHMNIVLYLTVFITLLSYFIKIKLNEIISQAILDICFYIIKLTSVLFFLYFFYLRGHNQNVDFFMLKCFMFFSPLPVFNFIL